MNYPFILKFTSVKNLSDARFAAGHWADFVGFCFDPNSPDYIDPLKAKEIISWIKGPILCGEFAHQPIDWIQDFISSFDLKAIEIPSDYPYPEIFKLENIRFILRVSNTDKSDSIQNADLIITRNKEVYAYYKALGDTPVILEIESTDVNAGECDGIALVGVQEDKPGTRNQLEWTVFLEQWVED